MTPEDDLDAILNSIKKQEPPQQQQRISQPMVSPQQPYQFQSVYQPIPMQPPGYQMPIPAYMQPMMQPQPMYPQPIYSQPIPQQPMIQPQAAIIPKQMIMAPDDTTRVDLSHVIISPEQEFQIYVGGLPPKATDVDLQSAFQVCGEIKNVYCSNHNYAFVNFKYKNGAMAAFMQRDFMVRGQKVQLASFHKGLQIILRRLPQKINDDIVFQSVLNDFIRLENHDIFVYSQLARATSGYSAYLHFLSKDESIRCFNLLRTTKFTQYCAGRYNLVPNLDQLRIVTVEEVEQREKAGQQPNQDASREVLQFLCVRYVEKNKNSAAQGGSGLQQQVVSQQQQYVQYQNTYQGQIYNQPVVYSQQPQHHVAGSKIISSSSVYLKMMPFKTTQDEVRAAMSRFGEVVSIALINDKEDRGMNPCAIVYMNGGVSQALSAGQVLIKPGQNPCKIMPHTKKQ